MFSPVYCWARGRCGESFLELEQCGEDLVQSPGQDDDDDDSLELKRCSTMMMMMMMRMMIMNKRDVPPAAACSPGEEEPPLDKMLKARCTWVCCH